MYAYNLSYVIVNSECVCCWNHENDQSPVVHRK